MSSIVMGQRKLFGGTFSPLSPPPPPPCDEGAAVSVREAGTAPAAPGATPAAGWLRGQGGADITWRRGGRGGGGGGNFDMWEGGLIWL